MSDLIGRTLGPYQLVEQLGLGGMATVYKAYHPAMDRYVALKVLPQHMAGDPNFRARFQREARTIARLEHRYILPVHDTGEQDGIHYLVMRYTESGTLSNLISSGMLSMEQAVKIIAQVAEALAYAHRQGVIHRDIKPANVLISREGDAMLSDFGIARIVEGTMQLTGEGMLIGTPFYMAPEQVQGQPSDARTDIYALGVVLYEVLTGRRPYEAETPLAVALMHLHNPLPPPRQVKPDLPEVLERVILRAMAKNPDDRFQSAGEMAEELHAWEQSARTGQLPNQHVATPPTPPPTPVPARAAARSAAATVVLRNRPAWLWPLVGIGGVLLVGAVILAIVLSNQGRPVAEDQPPPSEPGIGSPPAGEPATAREHLRLLSSTAFANGMDVNGETVWVATPGGLVRWVDDESRIFTSVDGLPFTTIRALLVVPDGTLWLAGEQAVAHVSVGDDELGSVSTYTVDEGLGLNYVRAFLRDNDGAILAGGYLSEGLVRFNGTTWEPFPLPLDTLSDLNSDIQDLARGLDGALYIAVAEGLLRWDGQTITRYTEEQGLPAGGITTVLADTKSNVWATAGDNGLLRLNATEGRWERVATIDPNLAIWSISELNDGRLWATSWEIILESSDSGETWRSLGASGTEFGYAPRAVVQDAAGRVWAGSIEGVAVFESDSWDWRAPEGELPDAGIGYLTLRDGQIWAVPLYNGPIALVDPDDEQVERPDLPFVAGSALAFSEETTWIGNSDGLFRVRGDSVLQITEGLPDQQVRSLLATDSTLWIGTQQGLVAYDIASESLAEPVEEFQAAIIHTLFQAPDGAIWAGTSNDGDSSRPVLLGRYDGSEWQIWRAGEGPVGADSSGATALNADSEGQIWAAFWNGGIYRWDGEDWNEVSGSSNAPEGNVLALQPYEDSMIAAGSFAGLYRWNSDGWSIQHIDGLPAPANSLLLVDEELWIGTNEGLFAYSP